MDSNERIVNILRESKYFFFATVNNGQPNVRPFNAVVEFEGRVYLYTNNHSSAYKQLIESPKIGICAMLDNDRWMKLKANVVFDSRVSAKKVMLAANPNLRKIYSEKDKIFEVFYLSDISAKIHSNYDSPEIIC